MASRKIKVFIIEDSALTRAILEKIIGANSSMEVVGSAINPIIAAKKIQKLQPDVITLDLVLPDMDGFTFLKKLRKTTDIPVVVISGNSPKSGHNAVRALELGALEVIQKPDVSTPNKLQDESETIHRAIISAFNAKLGDKTEFQFPLVKKQKSVPAATGKNSEQLILIGSSTGGPELLKAMFKAIDGNSPGVVVAQHMPEAFTRSFADRLNEESDMQVVLAEHGDRILDGKAYILPGNHHGEILEDRNGFYISLNQSEKVNRHRPSVDVLFKSAAKSAGARATGILLTGMGNDGAAGMLELREKGSTTIAQDENSCVVYGMPKQAKIQGGVSFEMAPEQIVEFINNQQFISNERNRTTFTV